MWVESALSVLLRVGDCVLMKIGKCVIMRAGEGAMCYVCCEEVFESVLP